MTLFPQNVCKSLIHKLLDTALKRSAYDCLQNQVNRREFIFGIFTVYLLLISRLITIFSFPRSHCICFANANRLMLNDIKFCLLPWVTYRVGIWYWWSWTDKLLISISLQYCGLTIRIALGFQKNLFNYKTFYNYLVKERKIAVRTVNWLGMYTL